MGAMNISNPAGMRMQAPWLPRRSIMKTFKLWLGSAVSLAGAAVLIGRLF
jgi:hypothetical protein